jgi:CRISPR/Cas system-associated exonuclease Cas4 (RecB family)
MLKKANDGIAPTALNAYRSCPLRFYFSDIAGLREPDEAGDTIDPKSLGTAVHGALQQLFGPLKGQVIRDRDVESMLRSADEAVEQAFSRKFTGAAVSSGKNLLLVHVARLLVRNFLKSELALVEDLAEKGHTLTIGLLEQFLRKTIQVNLGEEEISVVIKGVVDRTDRIGGVLRVIDYKTGQADRRELSVDDWQDLLDDPALDKAFQLLTYAWLMAGDPDGQPVRAGIISLRRPGSGLLTVQVPGEGRSTDSLGMPEIGHFGSILAELVSAIFDTAKPFVQTSNTDACARCPYAAICGR